jgi:hypothetical protein
VALRARNTGKDHNRADLEPRFYFRHAHNGKRMWTRMKATVLSAANSETEAIETALEAQAKRLPVAELAEGDVSSFPLKMTIEKFLDLKRSKAPRTVAQYTPVLNQFLGLVRGTVRFVDQSIDDVASKPACTIPTTFQESVENTDVPLAALCVMMSAVNPWGRRVCLQNGKTL